MRGLLYTLLKLGVALVVAKAATSRRGDDDAGPTSTGAEPETQRPAPAQVPVQAPAHVNANAPLQGTFYTISANPAFPQYRTSREFRFDGERVTHSLLCPAEEN